MRSSEPLPRLLKPRTARSFAEVFKVEKKTREMVSMLR